MPKVYSYDFRLQVVSCVERGKSREEIEDFFGVGYVTIKHWVAAAARGELEHYNERGSYKPRKIDSDVLRKELEKQPDATLKELAVPFGCCFQAVDRRLKKLGITRKKNHAVRGAGRGKKGNIPS